jgi:hypothetical protein
VPDEIQLTREFLGHTLDRFTANVDARVETGNVAREAAFIVLQYDKTLQTYAPL